MKRTLAVNLALLATLVLAPAAMAQSDYPSRPITIVVPFPPGGSSDTVIRPIAQKVAESLKATIVIENRPGAGGNVAALSIKQAAPDGYTLFLANNGTFGINPALFKELRFDPTKDFAPITPLVSFPSVLAVPAGLPARSVKELVALAKTRATMRVSFHSSWPMPCRFGSAAWPLRCARSTGREQGGVSAPALWCR